MEPGTARDIWHRLEHVNAVTYFAPECGEATTALGLRGFWAGYFANRAAPMGPAPAGVVEATFFNFHPAQVRRAIPHVWNVASPGQLVDSRRAAAAAALRRMLPKADHLAGELGPSLIRCIEAADGGGRALFAANREIAVTGDLVGDLWQVCTTLREHRGDGHVAILAAEGLDGCEVHVLSAATQGLPPELLQASRGWSADDWAEATERLAGRGLLDADGAPTEHGRELRASIEARTDELAVGPYLVMSEDEVKRLLLMTSHAARAIAGTELIPYPNPMGLPPPP